MKRLFLVCALLGASVAFGQQFGRWPVTSGSSAGTPGPPGPAGPTGPSGPPFVPISQYTAPYSVTADGGIPAPGATINRTLLFISGSPGAVVVTANPAIGAGSFLGQEMVLLGASDTNTVTFNSGNGVSMNGPIVMTSSGAGSVVWFIWAGTFWNEASRR